MDKKKGKNLRQLILSAMFLAIAIVLPFMTGQIPQMGNALCPMHIPVILCGFFCGPWYAAAVGFLAPLLRFAIFGMPAIFPNGLAMSFELAAYGFAAAILYKYLPKKKPYVYVALIGSMIFGRLVWGMVRGIISGFSESKFGFEAFIAGALLNAFPGIVVQIILIPILVMILEEYTYIKEKEDT